MKNSTQTLTAEARALRGRRLSALRLALAALALAASASVARPAFAQSSALAQPSTQRAQTGIDYYYCVMDRDVVSHKPGKCPKCHMELRAHHAAITSQAASQPDDAHAPATTNVTAPETTNDTAKANSAAKTNDAAKANDAAKTNDAAPKSVAADASVHVSNDAASAMSIPDIELVDQDGRKVHFYSDLVRGRTVAIQFIFTTCTTICPPLGATFHRVEQMLGARAGSDVRLISVSVDPATDTPERLKAWGAKFHAGPGWTFVTGAKPAVDELLRALGAQNGRPEDHTPAILVGNDARGQWTRTYGLARPTQLVEIIDAAFAGRLNTSTKESPQQ